MREPPSLPLVLGLALILLAGSVFAWAGVAGIDPNPFRAGWDALPLSTDDAVRIVQVRDLGAGQGWFDHRQTRLGAGEAVMMHWSRLVDAPLLGLVRAAEAVTDPAQAERVAAAVWPRLLALLWAALSLGIAGQLAGRRGVWCAAFLLMPAIALAPEFRPGRVDHHNVQLLAVLAAASALIAARRRPALAAAGGAAAALSLTVGLETLPALAAAGAAVAARTVRPGAAPDGRAARWFALGLGLALPAAMATTLPPRVLVTPLCDQISPATAIPILIACAGLAALTGWPARPHLRLAALGVLSLAAAGMALLIAPECLSGPYAALDAEVLAGMALIGERADLLGVLEEDFGAAFYRFVLWPLTGLVGLGAGMLTAPPERRFGLTLLFWMTLAATAVGWAEIRGMRLALPLALLGGVVLLDRILGWRGALRPAAPVAMLALLLAVTPLGAALAPVFASSPAPPEEPPLLAQVRACTADEEVAPLAALPPGRVLGVVDLGAFLLLKTPHTVVAAPYHRNAEGLRAGYRFARAGAGAVRRLVADLGVDYLVICRGYGGRIPPPPDSLRAALGRGEVPPWLRPLGGGERLRIYRVAE